MTITPQRPGDSRSPNLNPGARSNFPTPNAPAQIPLARLLRFLERTAASDFFGRITVSFQNGRLGEIKIEQVLKPDEL